MEKVFALLSIGLISLCGQYASAQTCYNFRTYSSTFEPACDPQDMFVLWPIYDNPSNFTECVAPNRSVVKRCPSNTYFTFVMQTCTSCADYIPPINCTALPTQNPPVCSGNPGGVTLPGGETFPTPIYPTSTTSTTTTTTTTTTRAPITKPSTTTTTTSTPPTPTITTPTTPSTPSPGPTPPTAAPVTTTSSTEIPPPKSPSTVNTAIPMPETPAPTPPSISVQPGYVTPVPPS